ncbi:MAG: purine-nucleoside phosphorylase [Bacteroides sp.]
MGTPHNEADKGSIAKAVLMPGDPLRAKFIADNFLENAVCFNTVRNMFGFTGTYKGKKISVMGSGMGMPSMAIYSNELFSEYDVDTIIRIGSAGGYAQNVKVRDIVIAMATSTDSNFAAQYKLGGSFAPTADFGLLRKAVEAAERNNISVQVGNVLSTDVFYHVEADYAKRWRDMGVLATEMECAALYMNAAYFKKKALGIFTVSDHLFTGESLSAKERETSFTDMMKIALEIA